ncbi:MAG: gas vesicle protein GvpD P-loop domain-containing protein [Thermoplasmata archaeon]
MNNLDAIPGLSTFFGSSGSQSLIIEGAPGTGKTTFALQILETFKSNYKGIYLSTRVGDSALYQHFPWIKELEEKTKIIDSGLLFLESLKIEVPETEQEHVESARTFIRTIYGDQPNKASRILYNKYFKDLNIPELKRIYSEVDHNLPDRSMIVIDSIEGLASKYRINEEELVYTLVKDLVEGGNTDIIFVLEKQRSENLEYIADGVIVLEHDLYDERIIRSLSIEKLRGIESRFKKYLFTLKDGKFYVFSHPINLDVSKHFDSPISANENNFSTGVKELDNILGGGYTYGSVNLIEYGENVGLRHHILKRPIVANTLLLDHGILVALTLGDSIEDVRSKFSTYINDKSRVDTHIIFIDYTRSNTDKEYIIPLGNKNKEKTSELIQQAITKLKTFGSPVFYIMAFEAIEKYRGKLAIQETIEFVNSIIENKDIGILTLLPGAQNRENIINMASTHIKLILINNTLCLYGINPKTNIYVIEPAEDSLTERFYKLTPIT